MRAWLLGVGWLLMTAMPAFAATRVTIHDLKDDPERYYDQTVLLECYYDKESPIWVRALPDADEWIGFFVTGKPEKVLTWSGEYYNLLFAPYGMRDAVRSLRGGDKITVIGEAFQYHSASFDGTGIHVQRLLSGWGPSAKTVGVEPAASVLMPTAHAAPPPAPADAPPAVAAQADEGRYTVTINGRRYQGLRFGDPYTFEGVEFQVDNAR